MATLADYEVAAEEWQVNYLRYGVRVFCVPASEVKGMASQWTYGTFWPGESGSSNGKRIWRSKVTWEYPGRPGKAKVTVEYKTLSYSEYISLKINEDPNKAIVSLSLSVKPREVLPEAATLSNEELAWLTNPNGGKLSQQLTTKDLDVEWVPIGESNWTMETTATFRISVAMASLAAVDAMDLANSINTDNLPNLRVGPGMFYCMGVANARDIKSDKEWPIVDWLFMFDPAGWANKAAFQKVVKVPIERQVLDAQGAIFQGKTKAVVKTISVQTSADGASTTTANLNRKYRSFGWLDAMVSPRT